MLGQTTVQLAQAVEVTLSAEYRGEQQAIFIHTTPPALACAIKPSFCARTPTVTAPVSYTRVTRVTTVPRENLYLSIPGPRQGQVAHEQTGETYPVELTFNRVAQRVASPNPERNPANSSYAISGTNCQVQRGQPLTLYDFQTHWNFPKRPGDCATRPARSTSGQRETVTASELSLAYTLTLPSPYRLKPGRYRGSINYTLGTGRDFDFGDQVSGLSDNDLTFNLVLDVEHTFRVEFDAGFERAVLEPPGGWTAWLDGGRVPPRIASDQSMRVWSSGPFRVYKLCEYDVGDNCGIRNLRGEDVPVQVAVTMPWGIRDYQGWQAINRRPLPTGRVSALLLEGQLFTANGPGQLHFEVAQADLRPMLERAGERYSGKVTVMFDAEL